MLHWAGSRSAVGSDKGIIDRAPTHRRGLSLRRHNVNLRAKLMLRLPKSAVLVYGALELITEQSIPRVSELAGIAAASRDTPFGRPNKTLSADLTVSA